ncbi:MAG: aminotransferase class V-fold PLP-dependent enzyme [Caldilineaceae bacterium]
MTTEMSSMMRNPLPPISNTHRISTQQLDVPLRTLLGTGPSNVPSRVLQALGTQVVGSDDVAFQHVLHDVQELLRYVWQTDNECTFAFAGGEQAALEAAIASVLQPGDVIVVGDSGQHSERIERLARGYGVTVKRLDRKDDGIVQLDDIRSVLETHRPTLLALVHGDLATGALQPLDGVGALCRKHDVLLMVDTIGSLGATPVYVDAWGIDICYSTVDKCLSAVPGLSLITANERALERMRQRPADNVPAQCLQITQLAEAWLSADYAADLLPVNLVYALREALRIIADEGLVECWQRHRNNAELLWFGLEDLHIACPVALAHRLPSLTVVNMPAGVDSNAIKRHLLSHYNIAVAPSAHAQEPATWRIGLMGYNSRAENVTLLPALLEDALRIFH